MAFINPNHRGLAYGDGYLQGDGESRSRGVELMTEVPIGAGLTLRLEGSNLLDVTYTPTADNRAALAPGRSLRLSATWRAPPR